MATAGAMSEFARLPTGKKVTIFVVIAVLLGAIYYKFVFSDLKAELQEVRTLHETTKATNKKLEADIPRFAKLRAKKAVLDAMIREHQRALPTEAEVPAFFEGIERKVTEAGVEVTKWTKKPEEPVDAFVKVPLDVELTGTFLQLKRFFASLVEKKPAKRGGVPGEPNVEERERIVSVEDLVISQPTIRNREVILTAKFTAVTFRQEDTEPDAPGAATKTGVGPPGSSTPSGSSAPPMPSAGTPAGAKVRVEDSLKQGEERVNGSGSARLNGGL